MVMADAAIVMLLIFLLIGASGAFYYFFIYKKDEATPSPSPSPTSSPPLPVSETSSPPPSQSSSTPTLDTLLALGQKLEDDEFDAGAGKKTVTKQPTGIDKTKVTYTLSMDIKVVTTAVDNFRLLHNRDDTDNSAAVASSARRPELWISGSSHKDGANHIWINHVVGATGITEGFLQTTFKATDGVYFNLTYVIDSGKCTVYINGVKDGEYSGDFKWSQDTDNWTWNLFGNSHSVKVKNVYFFNKALTVSEVELIGKKQTSGTSTYVMPYTSSVKMCDI